MRGLGYWMGMNGVRVSDRTRLGLGTLGAACVLGVLGDALLRATPWGVNVSLWVVGLVAATLAVARWRGIGLRGGGKWLALPALFFASALAWRDSPALIALNLLALLMSLALAALRSRTGKLRVGGVLDYALGLLAGALSAGLGSLALLFGDIRWRETPRGRWSKGAAAVGRGLLLALPLLLIFGTLFVAADAMFQGLVSDLFGWDPAELFSHAVLAGTLAWLTGGLLRQTLLGRELENPVGECPSVLTLGITEMTIVLGTLNALFLAFVAVQFRYFFGGAALVEASTDLSYAEYARRGFFELVTVAALVLPLLLLADWVRRREKPAHDRLFRALTGLLVLLLFVIMASALERMRLYRNEYGLTELRLYTTVFMGWLAAVFVWFLATVLRGRRRNFAFGALVAGFIAIALLDALNPDAYIVKTNVARANPRQPVDAYYLTSLSADAAPALAESLPSLPERERRIVATRLVYRWSYSPAPDWRTWNWARSRAREEAATDQVVSQAGNVPPPPSTDRVSPPPQDYPAP